MAGDEQQCACPHIKFCEMYGCQQPGPFMGPPTAEWEPCPDCAGFGITTDSIADRICVQCEGFGRVRIATEDAP